MLRFDLRVLGSSDSPASALKTAATRDAYCYTWGIFCLLDWFFETGFNKAQVGLELIRYLKMTLNS